MKAGSEILEAPAPAGKEFSVEFIDVSRIVPTRDNPRRVDIKAQSFKDLVASVKARGVLVPVIGRPDPKRAGVIDLRAGARRYAAACEAGLSQIPAVIYAMSDEEAMEITVLENLQREQLSPMEEARGIAQLRSVNKSDEDIGAKIGKSMAWVRRRAQLLHLLPAVVKAWEMGGDYRLADASIAALEALASFEKEVQKEIWDHAHHGFFSDIREFNRVVNARYVHLLAKAPWDLGDGDLLPKAGACTACPKRSSVEPLLFHEVLDVEEVRKCDRCLDAACFNVKMEAFKVGMVERLRREHPTLVKVSTRDDYGYRDSSLPKDTLSKSEFIKAAKSDKSAVPAFVESGPGEGSLIYVKKGKRAAADSGGSGKSTTGVKPLSERRQILEGRRLVAALARVGQLLDASSLPEIEPTVGHLARLVQAFGIAPLHEVFDDVYEDEWPDLKAVRKLKDEVVAKRLWALLKPSLHKMINTSGGPSIVAQSVKAYTEAGAGVCGLIGADWGQLKAEADAALPEPKGWALLNDDGSPRNTSTPAVSRRKKAKEESI